MSWVADGANSEFNTGFEERIAPTAGGGGDIVTVSEGYRAWALVWRASWMSASWGLLRGGRGVIEGKRLKQRTGAFYRPPDDRGASELPHEAQLGAVAVVILRLGVGLARLVDER